MPSPILRTFCFLLFSGAVFYAGRVTGLSGHIPVSPNGSKSLSVSNVALYNNVQTEPLGSSGEHPTEKQIKTWKQRLDGMSATEARDEERLQLVAAWALIDPLAAMDYARKSFSHDARSSALTTVFTNWAKKDPNAAWAWVTTNEPGAHADLRSVLAQTARTDPMLAGQFAAQFATAHPEAAAEVYFAALDGAFHNGNFDAAKLLVANAQMPNEEQKNSLINLLAGQWARYQPENAAAWVMGLPAGAVRDQALDAVGQAWSDIDPVHAANFAVNLPPGAARQTALRQAISKWTMDDPAQASNWILQFDAHQDFDQAVASIATSYNVMNRNTNLALNWAATIQDPTLRKQSVTSIISTWYVNDAAAALKYIKSSPDLSNETRQQLLQVVNTSGSPPLSNNP